MPSFYFEQLLQTGLNGIDQQGITAAVLQIAGIILILSLLWAAYEAYISGGDVRLLGVAAVKYLVLGLVFLNYQGAFRAVNSMFNSVADGIYNLSGGMDVIKAWGNSLSQAWNSNPNWFSALWNWATGGVSAVVAGLISLVGYLLLPFTYTLFTLFYVLYGAILYVAGPFVLALMPSRGLGQMGRSFLTNMMIFQCWGLLYAILQSLMSALQITDPMQLSSSYLQAFVGSSQVIVMSVASVLLSIMIALIPFIASRIVRGDIGNTLMTVISGAVTASAVASGLAFAGGEGAATGRTPAPAGPPAPQGGGRGGANPRQVSVVAAPNSSNGGSVLGESRSPTPLGSEISYGRAGAAATAGNPNPSSSGDSSSSSASAVDSSVSARAGSTSALRNPTTGQCSLGTGAAGKNLAKWPRLQSTLLPAKVASLTKLRIGPAGMRSRESRLCRSEPRRSPGMAGWALGWQDDVIIGMGKEQ